MRSLHGPVDIFESSLWSARLRASKSRRVILEALSLEKKPISASDLCTRLKKRSEKERAGHTSIYKNLEALADAGLVTKVHTGKMHALYEISLGRAHHHHAICMTCGLVEDVKTCDVYGLENSAYLELKDFASIDRHSLEFFGLCKKCATIRT